MFESVTDTSNDSSTRLNTQKVRKFKNLQERLIYIFDSLLDDIEIPTVPKKIKKNTRKHTLPVSIKITDKNILKPLEINKKRKSENDLGLVVPSKVLRTEVVEATVNELLNLQFETATDLANFKVINERVVCIITISNTQETVVTSKAKVCEADEIKMVKKPEVIDLTLDDGKENSYETLNRRNSIILDNGVKIEILESSRSSENANVPIRGVSMPFLSPVSPSRPAQLEPTLPETSQTTSHINMETVSALISSNKNPVPTAQRPPPNTTLPNENQQNAPQESSGNHLCQQQKQPVVTHNLGISPSGGYHTVNQHSQPSNSQLHSVNQQTPHSQTIQQQPLQPTISTNQQSQKPAKRRRSSNTRHTVIHYPPILPSNLHTNQVYGTPPQQNVQSTLDAINRIAQYQQQQMIQKQPQPLLPTYEIAQQQQSHSQNVPQQFPQLIRLCRPTNNQNEYHLLTNAECANKIFPHVFKFSKWRESACNFCQDVKTILMPREFMENYGAFNVYAEHTITTFGKNLIKDLLTFDVENFNLIQVLTILAGKMQEKSVSSTPIRMCYNFYSMLKSCEHECTTPFTQKFFKHVQMAVAKLETRHVTNNALFTTDQLKLLEFQIKQYKSLCSISYSRQIHPNTNRPPPQYPGQHVQKQNEQGNTAGQKNPSLSVLEKMLLNVGNFNNRPAINSNNNSFNTNTVPLSHNNVSTMPQNTVSGVNTLHGQSTSSLFRSIPEPNLATKRSEEICRMQKQSQQSNVHSHASSQNSQNTVPEVCTPLQPTNVCNATSTNSTITPETCRTQEQQSTECNSTQNTLSEPCRTQEQSNKESVCHTTQADLPPKDNSSTVPVCEARTSPSLSTSENVPKIEPCPKTVSSDSDEIIDLTWIDDGDDEEVMKEIKESKAFPFKVEGYADIVEVETHAREAISPADSGLGSPRSHQGDIGNESFKCLCGKDAIYLCACSCSMYCSSDCQAKDWEDHQRWCKEMNKSS